MYALLRNQYIPRYYHRHPSMLKLTQLLNSTNVKVLNKLALFCRNAFKLRTNELNSLLWSDEICKVVCMFIIWYLHYYYVHVKFVICNDEL
jgi:hypothetical protein